MRLGIWGSVCCVAVASVLISGCHPDEDVVGAVPNRQRCPTCLKSRRDNPILQGVVDLGIDRGGPEPHEFPESAERNPFGFIYENMRVDASIRGDDRKGATSLDLTPWPRLIGSYAADPEARRVLPWELHGIELGYALSEANISKTSALGNRILSTHSPIKVELDAGVMLVPIQVIRVVPSDPSAPFAANLAKYTKATYKKYFDDPLDLDTFRDSEPGVPNKYSQHTVNATALPWDNADEIWDQCGIQFRMITCPGSQEGCPDLVVEDPLRIAAAECPSPLGPSTVRQNWEDAEQLPGVNRDLPIVTFTWRITSDGCAEAGLAKTGRAALGFAVAQNATSRLVAHELGHVLGAPDYSDCAQTGEHLMCNHGDDSAHIQEIDCKTARQTAARYVQAAWGQTVTP
jgi:hypothetical protein